MNSELRNDTPQAAGSPAKGEPVYLVVGRLRRPHGVRGEIIMDILTDFPERLKPNTQVYLGDEHKPLQIIKCRNHSEGYLISFAEFNLRDEVSDLRNEFLYIRSDQIPDLPDGEYYHHQVLGLKVISMDGDVLGKLVQILETGANDVYVVQPEAGNEILLPVVDEVIQQVDFEQGVMIVRLIPGLIS